MTMKAVKFAPENFSLMLEEEAAFTPLTAEELETWYQASLDAGKTYYYAPRFDQYQWPEGPSFWRFFSADAMDELFTYDKDKINTEFVEITRK